MIIRACDVPGGVNGPPAGFCPGVNRPSPSLRAWAWAFVASVVLVAATASAQAAPAGDSDEDITSVTILSPAAILSDAGEALDAGEYQRAADLARGVLANSDVARVDRTEAWRLYGLAAFFLERFDRAENAFFEYLKLDVDGRLDPALVPPEAIVFFEDVRARNAAELRQYRPKPKQRRSIALNLLPPLGQFQNGDRVTGWALTGIGSAAVITLITTYVVLDRWCQDDTNVCSSGGESRAGAAETLKGINLAAGVVLAGAAAYGIYDGFRNFRRDRTGVASGATIELAPGPTGVYLGLRVRF